MLVVQYAGVSCQSFVTSHTVEIVEIGCQPHFATALHVVEVVGVVEFEFLLKTAQNYNGELQTFGCVHCHDAHSIGLSKRQLRLGLVCFVNVEQKFADTFGIGCTTQTINKSVEFAKSQCAIW